MTRGARSGLELLADRGVIAPLDRTLAEALARLVDERDPHVLLGAALASRAVSLSYSYSDTTPLPYSIFDLWPFAS